MSNANKEPSVATDSASDTESAASGFAHVTSELPVVAFVNPTDFEDYWRNRFYGTLYYTSGCIWKDYRPAYRLGYDAYFDNLGQKFEQIESEIARSWETVNDDSQLTWSQAKHAVRDGWLFVEWAISDPSPERDVQ